MVRQITSTQEWAAFMAKDWVIVDFFATWCGPCKAFAPIFERMEPQYPACIFIKVDVDQLDDVAGQNGVRAMPTFMLFNKGRRVDQVMGASEAKVRNMLERHVPKGPLGGGAFQGGGQRLGSGQAASSGPSDLYFTGSVTEAIGLSKAQNKPLVVFLDASDPPSQEMASVLHKIDMKPVLASKGVVLRLPEDLDAPPHELAQYAGARLFRQVYPTDTLPTLAVISPAGKPLLFHKGRVTDKVAFARNIEAALSGQDVVAVASQLMAAAARAHAQGGLRGPSSSSEGQAGPSAPAPPAVKPAAPAKPMANAALGNEAAPKKPAAAAKKPAGAAAAPPPPAPEFDTVQLSLRMLDGSTMTGTFEPSATLAQVRHHIDLNRTDGGAPYSLALSYPRTVYTAADYEKDLKSLGLGPRSALLLLPTTGGTGPSSASQGSRAEGGRSAGSARGASLYGTASWLYNTVTGTASWLLGVGAHAPPSNPPASEQEEGQTQRTQPATEATPSAAKDAGNKRRVVGLKDVRGEENDEGPQGGDGGKGQGKNQYWGGDSTVFEGGKDGGKHNE